MRILLEDAHSLSCPGMAILLTLIIWDIIEGQGGSMLGIVLTEITLKLNNRVCLCMN